MGKQQLVHKKERTWIRWLIIAVAVLVPFLLVAGAGAYYYQQYATLNKMTAEQFSQRENDKTIKAVAKLYSLPKDEQPSIAAIKDKEAVKKQYPFLSQAENDDILLLYKNAQLALLYRPSTKQLVKVGALNIQNTEKVSVIGKTADRQSVLKTLTDAKLNAVDSGDAKASYVGVTVVDIAGTNAALAAQIAASLKGQVASLPSGEEKPADTAILVIAGSAAPAEQPAQ